MPDEKFSRTMRLDLIPDVSAETVSVKKKQVVIARPTRKHHRVQPMVAERGKATTYQQLLQNIYDAVIITDLIGRIVDVNVRALEFLQYNRVELTGLTIFDVISGSDESLLQTLWENLKNERFTLIQAHCVRKDGSFFPAEIAVNKLRLDEMRLCFFLRDITVRRQAEEMLRTEHNAIQNSGNGIVVADLNLEIEYANPAVANMWGFNNQDELVGQDVRILLSDRETADEMINIVMGEQQAWTGEMVASRNGESEFDVQISAACNRNSDGEPVGIVFSFVDITVRKQADFALKEANRLINTLMDNIPDHIYFKDKKSRFIRINKSLARWFGAKHPDEAIGKTDSDMFTNEHASEAYADEQKIIKTGQPVMGKEEKETWPDGSETWVSTTKMPLLDSNGEIVGTFGISRDVSERKQAQEAALEAHRRMESTLRELSESKSQFVAEASHELRTPLGIMREFVSLLDDEIVGPVTAKQKECLRSVIRNCDRLTELINKMLDLARIEAGKVELNRTRADIAPLLTECRDDFLPKCHSKKQELLLEIPDDLPAVYCDTNNIRNVLVNLVGNAHKFAPEGGRILIGCQHEGQFVSVYVDDNGPGIAPEAKERIFEAFAQVDRQDGPGAKGTGLGLAIAKNLVKLNGGYMFVDSTPGKGSRFSFNIPLYEREVPRRVLVVDDDERVVKVITQVLQSSDLNLEVKSTLSGWESLVIAGQFNPQVIILDAHLTEIDSKQVLASLKQKLPEKIGKVLMISEDDAAGGALEEGADDYLVKPFSPSDLIQKIVTLLKIERRKG